MACSRENFTFTFYQAAALYLVHKYEPSSNFEPIV
jgi:hypothetical protein